MINIEEKEKRKEKVFTKNSDTIDKDFLIISNLESTVFYNHSKNEYCFYFNNDKFNSGYRRLIIPYDNLYDVISLISFIEVGDNIKLKEHYTKNRLDKGLNPKDKFEVITVIENECILVLNSYTEITKITKSELDRDFEIVKTDKASMCVPYDNKGKTRINTTECFKKPTEVYLASPFFNDKELVEMTKVLGALRNKGLNVFAPFENQNKQYEFASDKWRKATFKSDVMAIDKSDIIVAIISGNYTDSGTAWEIGYAYAKNKPILIVNLSKDIVNLMISDSLLAYFDNLEDLENYDFENLVEKKYKNYVF